MSNSNLDNDGGVVSTILSAFIDNGQKQAQQIANQEAQREFDFHMEFVKTYLQDELQQREHERKMIESFFQSALQNDNEFRNDFRRQLSKYPNVRLYDQGNWLSSQGLSRQSRHLFVVVSTHFVQTDPSIIIPNPMQLIYDGLVEHYQGLEKVIEIIDTGEGFSSIVDARMFFAREIINKPAIIVYGFLKGSFKNGNKDLELQIEVSNLLLGKYPLSDFEDTHTKDANKKGKEKFGKIIEFYINSLLQALIEYSLVYYPETKLPISWEVLNNRTSNKIDSLKIDNPTLAEDFAHYSEYIEKKRNVIQSKKASKSPSNGDDSPFI
jgi:hypothetical protein